ncbi:hypothetical protein AT03_11700 [Hafnia alvei FB1]|uniref:Uncharacterized protein n=1 Tax=Hafnia alvei FB1 TaxID=1453496 RepID=A0A097R2N6_HAFAL|nr:hypothetical protein [Hafnia alvei]AIU72983.1 hypothetical protein AT03_11700 [Hafnia alvei FB1]
MSAQLNNSLIPDLVSKDITSYGIESINRVSNLHSVNASASGSFMVNISHKNAKNTKLFIADENSFMSSEYESEKSAIFDMDQDEINLKKFLESSKERHLIKAKREEAKRNFVAVRDCYGVIDRIFAGSDNKVSFEARIYQNSTNEFLEIINAPVDAFKSSDAELLRIGSVFYWKAGYRSTDKGTRIKVNDFNLRRIIRERSIIRKKRVENIVNDLFSIFQNA